MAYFAAKKEPEVIRKRGKSIGSIGNFEAPVPPEPKPLTSARLTKGNNARDEFLAGEVEKIHGDAKPGTDFLMSKLNPNRVTHNRGKNMNNALTQKTHGSNIFAAPRMETPPKLRIRPNFEAEELARIAPPDHRKDDAATKMQSKPTLVDQMYACNYPLPHKQEVYVPSKKRFHDDIDAHEHVAIDGFAGMGHLSKPIRHGSKAKVATDAPFVPELPPRKERVRYGAGAPKSEFNILTNRPHGAGADEAPLSARAGFR